MTRPDLNIKVKAVKPPNLKTAVHIVRGYSDDPVGSILGKLKEEEPFYCTTLLASEFYSGWRDLYGLVHELDENDITVELIVNGKVRGIDFVEEVKEIVENIKRSDIY